MEEYSCEGIVGKDDYNRIMHHTDYASNVYIHERLNELLEIKKLTDKINNTLPKTSDAQQAIKLRYLLMKLNDRKKKRLNEVYDCLQECEHFSAVREGEEERLKQTKRVFVGFIVLVFIILTSLLL